jgi:hypothetical protein
MASMAARVGLWNSALSLSELAGVLEDLQQQLSEIEIPKQAQSNILQQLYRRIEDCYIAEARRVVDTERGMMLDEMNMAAASNDVEERRKAEKFFAEISKEAQKMSQLDHNSIDALIRLIKESRAFDTKDELIAVVAEIGLDLQQFRKSRTFRRRDWVADR